MSKACNFCEQQGCNRTICGTCQKWRCMHEALTSGPSSNEIWPCNYCKERICIGCYWGHTQEKHPTPSMRS